MILKYEPQALLSPLTPNFKQYEVGRSDYATRLGIQNVPSLEILNRAQGVAVHCLQPARAKFGVMQINSWYRSESVEREMAKDGYAKWLVKNKKMKTELTWKEYFAIKQHPLGAAVDHEIPGVSNDELFEWYKNNVEFDQLIREFAKDGDPMSGWVHISWVEKGNRNKAFKIG